MVRKEEEEQMIFLKPFTNFNLFLLAKKLFKCYIYNFINKQNSSNVHISFKRRKLVYEDIGREWSD